MIPHHEFTGQLLTTPKLAQQLAGGFLRLFHDEPSASLKLGADAAVIPVIGALSHRAADMRSYSDISSEIKAAVSNPAIETIVLEIDSEGGAVSGCIELADQIHAIAQDKNKPEIIAYVSGTCASAAYLIASQCKRVLSTKYSQIGSIGVVMMHVDKSQAMKKAGISQTYIYAGDHKVDGNPTEALPADVKERMQGKINTIYELFINTVARGGRLSAQQAKATNAAMFSAEEAKALKLIDDMVSESDLSEYIKNPQSAPTLSASMPRGVLHQAKPPTALSTPIHSELKNVGQTTTTQINITGKEHLAKTLTRMGIEEEKLLAAAKI